jgi:hypothetical protein
MAGPLGTHLRKELEQLCRYIIRPVIANERQLCRVATVCNGSKGPVQFFPERTLKSEGPITFPSIRH